MNDIDSFLEKPEEEYWIECSSIRRRDSLRTQLFRMRSKQSPAIQDSIGIKLCDSNGKLFVVIYLRQKEPRYRMVNGELIPIQTDVVIPASSDEENLRRKMALDGVPQDQIDAYFKGV